MKFCDVVQFYSPLGGGVRRYLDDKMRYLAQKPDCEHTVIAPLSSQCNRNRLSIETDRNKIHAFDRIAQLSHVVEPSENPIHR